MDTGILSSATDVGSAVARPGPAVAPGLAGTRVSPRPEPAALGAEFDDVGRNDPCPCGSGKKFKKCHGAAG
jgi:preprotein translocase subunit SecA